MIWLLLTACASKRIDALEDQLATLEAENQALQARVTDLEQAVAEHEEPVAVMASVMEMFSTLGMDLTDGSSLLSPSTMTTPPAATDPLRQIRMVPHRASGGDIDGFRLSGIRRGSLWDAAGLKNGDILQAYSTEQHTERQPTTGMAELDPLLELMEEGQACTLYLIRRGAPAEVTIERRE